MSRFRLALAALIALALVLPACDGGDSFDDLITTGDTDGDTIDDDVDNCPSDPNPAQDNADGDAYGNVCDCTHLTDACRNESLAQANCSNGRDDDGDQLQDAADPNCRVESTDQGNCGDLIDNDGDGVLDCAEASCAGAPGCPGGP